MRQETITERPQRGKRRAMSAIALERPRARGVAVRRGIGRVALFVLVGAALWGLWEAYRWLWMRESWTWPFIVTDTSMPHLHSIFQALWEHARPGGVGPRLITILGEAALFTAKEAAAGFALGAILGFALGVLLAHFRLLQRGFLPWVVASQTVPILVIAPMIVVWLNPKLPAGLRDWGSVAVIAAYLTFFPVTINTIRGLQSADRRSLELMRSYAAGNWSILWKLRFPAALPYIFAALKVSATASVVGAIIGELPSSIQDGLGGQIINYSQYYTIQPTGLWATNVIAAALGIAFFLVVLIAEKIVVRRAPEYVA
jgi:NitT/TauT family transport system permease protein